MAWPTSRDWLFACKTYVAAILALYVAMSLGLERPYWAMASAFIASQPLSGATRSKAIFRGCGTVAGAAVAVALVPSLSNAPVLLSLALALWTGVCLYFALLDRRPSNYGFMLAGYTGAIIGFPSVAAPAAVFTTALTRVEEIGLGITIATLIAQVVFPRPVGPVLANRIDLWLEDARHWAEEALRGEQTADQHTRRLAGSAAEIDALAGHLGYDATSIQTDAFNLIRARMIMLLPDLAAITDRITALRADRAALPPGAERLFQQIADWIPQPLAPADALLARIEELEHASVAWTDWSGLIFSNLLARLREMVQILRDCAVLREHMAADAGTLPTLWFSSDATAAQAWHRDPGMAFLSGFAAVVAVLLTCAAWIATAWPDGAVAAEMVAVACSFFAAQDDPAPAIIGFLKASVVGVVADAILLFVLLPAATTFVGLVLVMAPFYLTGALLVAMPRTANFGRAFTANGPTLLALQSTYSGDFPSFVNSSNAFVLGLVAAAVITRLIRSVGADASANRLLRTIWQELAVAAEQRGKRDRARYAGVMLDRLGLIAPRLAENDKHSALAAAAALTDLRIGLNIIDLRRARHDLTAAQRERIDTMLDTLAAEYRARVHDRRMEATRHGARLLAEIDHALRAVATIGASPGRTDALLGLVGIRRGLFPEAAPFAMTPA